MKQPIRKLLLTYVLLLPLTFFAAHGRFSFQDANSAAHLSAVGRIGDAGQVLGLGADEDATAKGRTLVAVVVAIVLGCVATRWRSVCGRCVRMRALSILTLLAMISATWSQSAADTLHHAVLLAVSTLFAFFLAERFSEQDQAELLMLAGAFIAVASLLLAVLFPRFGTHQAGMGQEWQGIFVTKNVLAMVMLFLVVPAMFATKVSPTLRVAYIALAALLIFKAQSRTGFMLFVVLATLAAAWKVVVRIRLRDLTACIVMAIVISGSVGLFALQYSDQLYGLLGKDPTMTGRTEIWRLSMQAAMKRPLWGYGYAAFWRGLSGESGRISLALRWIVPYAHNGYLDLWLQLGVSGVALFLCTAFSAVRDAIRCLRFGAGDRIGWYVGIVLLTLAYNIDEGTLLYANQLPWILYILACCGLSSRARRSRESAFAENHTQVIAACA